MSESESSCASWKLPNRHTRRLSVSCCVRATCIQASSSGNHATWKTDSQGSMVTLPAVEEPRSSRL